MTAKHILRIKCIILSVIIMLAVVSAVFIIIGSDYSLTYRYYDFYTKKVSSPIRLVQISDLHSTLYGDSQEKLICKIMDAEPDAVMLTGDIFDNERITANGRTFLKRIGKLYPCFFVSGNHESDLEIIPEDVEQYGISYLSGDTLTVELNGQKISLSGIDPANRNNITSYKNQMSECNSKKDGKLFTVLLSHNPEYFVYFQKLDFDLILSGHAHGGQVRIPGLLNGVIAPNQHIFPDHAGGRYTVNSTTEIIVSRGLCINMLPRLYNPPEVVVIDILPENSERIIL